MLQEKYAKLDDLAAPNCYVAPPTSEDLSYVVHFRQICKRYNIDFSSADSDEFCDENGGKELYAKASLIYKSHYAASD